MPGFDELTQLITDYPYIGVAAIFLLCGLGLPLPEEIVLLAAGFVCAKYPDNAKLLPMMGWCGSAILVGDMIPFPRGPAHGRVLHRWRDEDALDPIPVPGRLRHRVDGATADLDRV